MKFKLPKYFSTIRFSAPRLFYGLAYVLIGLIFGVVGYFLYENFYQTITQSLEVIILKQEVAPDSVNMTKVKNILDTLQKKISGTTTPQLADNFNPFYAPTQTPIVSATTTSTNH